MQNTISEKYFSIAWLRREDWPRWRSIDPELPAYEKWLVRIETVIKEIEKVGHQHAEKIIVEPDRFVEWCRANGRKIGRGARAHYAAAVLARRIGAH